MSRSRRIRGFTLVELMIVVAIIGVVSAVGFASLSGSGKALDTASLARGLQFMMMRARQETASDNRQRQISCTLSTSSTVCQYLMASNLGNGAQVWTLPTAILLDTLRANSHATLWNVTTGADYNVNLSGATQILVPKTITFYPDGTVAGPSGALSSGATMYICDRAGNQKNDYKVYVYGGTGLSRMVDTW